MDILQSAYRAAGINHESPEQKRAAAVAIALEMIKSKALGANSSKLSDHMNMLNGFADLIEDALKVKP